MSLKFKVISAVSLAGAIALFSGASMAQDGSGTPAPGGERHQRGDHDGRFGGRRGPGGDRIMGELRGVQLTDAQKQQIKSIMDANKPDQSQFEQMRTLMEAKRNGTLTADQETQLKTFHEQQRTKMKSIHDQIFAILTPDQQTQVKKNRDEMEQHRKDWVHKRGSGPDAPAKPGSN